MAKEWRYGEDNKHIVLSEPPKQKLRITGHRVASVLGLNPYQTPFGSWCEITKLVKLPFEDTKYTIAGKTIEPKLIDVVREEFPNIMSIEEYYGNNLDRYKWNNFIDESDIFGGIIDAVGTKNDMKTITLVIECKTSSKPQEWDNNNVPLSYLLQGCEYAYLKKIDRVVFICAFLQEVDYNHPEKFVPTKENTKMVVKKIKDVRVEMPNGDLITFEEVIKYCEDWWHTYIETGISPPFDEKKDKEYEFNSGRLMLLTDSFMAKDKIAKTLGIPTANMNVVTYKGLANNKIKTGSSMTITLSENVFGTYQYAVLGDVYADGKVSAKDYMAIKNQIMGIDDISL